MLFLRKNLIWIILIGGLSFSCKKEKNERNFSWAQTQCADPWKATSKDDDQKLKSAVRQYLNVEGIVPIDIIIEWDEDLVQICQACSCTTGNKIIVTVLKNKEKKMNRLNFTPL